MSSTPPFDLEPQVSRKSELLVRTSPLGDDVVASLALDLTRATCAEISAGNELYGLVCASIVKKQTRSFTLDVGAGRREGCCDSDDDGNGEDEDEATGRVSCSGLGLGTFSFEFDGKMIHAVHQTLGEVVGTNCGAALYKTLVLVSESGLEPLTRFCDDLIARADVTSNAKFNIFRWHVQYSYWRKAETASARPVESVVLPMAMKDKLVDDLSEFVSPSTKAWYIEHGVPYKRSYLLHGSPGAGKTSLIQALAGRFKRNVCYLSSLSHPEMTDDGLKTAVQRLPPRSLVVLEDVDTLFGDGRRKRDGDKSALTFSGVLNALDGVGASSGQVFILTTNHRERLDPALIRNGRVDVHIEFTDATPEQMRLLFSQYYRSAATSLADKFADNLVELLGSGRTVSMACLQHYFIMKRKKTAEDAAADVQLIIDEMMAMGLGNKGDQKETDKATDDTAGAKHADAKDADEAKQPACKASATKVGSSGGKDVHVHLHIN